MSWRTHKPAPSPLSSRALLWLIAALGISILPHITRLPPWLSAIAAAAMICASISLNKPLKLSPWILWPLVLICLTGVTTHYGKFFGRDAGVSLLVVMLSLKLLETRSHRDGMVLVGLIYFSVITHFLYDQTIPLALFMLFAVAVNTFALITINEGPTPIAAAEKIQTVKTLLLSALPVMLVLFVLFPRIPGPIWGLPQDAYSARSGLSDYMTPGEFSQLALSNEVAFRVAFTGRSPKPEQLYWRALVLGNFDGRSWRLEDKPQMAEPVQIITMGDTLSYTVTLEPHNRRWLFALDMPTLDTPAHMLNGERMHLTSDRLLRSSKPILGISQYHAVSYPQYKIGLELNRYEHRNALQIPANSNPRTLELAQSWRIQTQQPEQLINYALDMFRKDFTYTLRPPILGFHSIDEFLFVTKKGFCEHFAGSFVFLMRAAGVPARVVTGYQGGELNPLGDYYLIRQSDAHAWAEVWLNQSGWVRIDPTNAVSPTRIELGLDAAIPAGERTGRFFQHGNSFLNNLGLFLDAIDNRWNLWVLGYGPETQILFLSTLGLKNPDAYKMIFILAISMSLLLGIIGLINWRNASRMDDPLQRAYLKLCKQLAKAGYNRLPHEGPANYAQRIQQQNAALGETLKPVLKLYAQLRYSQHNILNPAGFFRRRTRNIPDMLKKLNRPV